MNKINWKIRLRNKATLTFLIANTVAIVYQIVGFVQKGGVTQDAVTSVLMIVVSILAQLGIVVDPTTEGTGDSTQALGYDYPSPTAPTEPAKED